MGKRKVRARMHRRRQFQYDLIRGMPRTSSHCVRHPIARQPIPLDRLASSIRVAGQRRRRILLGRCTHCGNGILPLLEIDITHRRKHHGNEKQAIHSTNEKIKKKNY